MMLPHDLIIDCDPGIDDALALWLAASQTDRFRLRAVTTVAGNRPVDITSANAIRLLDAAGRTEVPVYLGAAQPLDGSPARCNLVHGADGLGGVELALTRPPEPLPAWQFLVHALEQHPSGTLTLATLGPLTNLALVEQHSPGLLRRFRQVVVMGGAVTCPGNITPAAEFNFYADPDAAQLVLQAGIEDLSLFGLDVTTKVAMSAAWLASLGTLPGRCASLAAAMLDAYASADPLLHDACPIAALLAPDLFHGEPWTLSVETLPGQSAGQSTGKRRPAAQARPGDVHVVQEVRPHAVLQLVREGLRALP